MHAAWRLTAANSPPPNGGEAVVEAVNRFYDRGSGNYDENTGSGTRLIDALSDILRVTQLSGGVFLRAEFTAPWCIEARMTPEHCASFLGPTTHLIPYHYVVEGELSISLENGPSQQLHAGDLVLFPGNAVHFMGSDLRIPSIKMGTIIVPSDGLGLRTIRHGGGGAPTKMICGYLGGENVRDNPIISTLPEIMALKADVGGSAEWIRSSFQFAADEVGAGRLGSATILSKLSELLFVEVIRSYVASLPQNQTGWLAGLRDPAVARTLALLHSDVARSWSVDELGREAGLSRSTLSERFVRMLGVAPMHYLANWRMQVAAHHLRNTNASLAMIAHKIGYRSEAAFSRAFKKAYGLAPAAWRRGSSG